MKRWLRSLRRDTSGVTTVELMVALPLMLSIVSFTMDLGLLMVRNVVLERAVDISIRDIRLGNAPADDYDGLRQKICENAIIIPECSTRLKMQLNAMSPYVWEDPGKVPDCESLKSVTVTAPRVFDAAARNQLVFFRACAVLDPVMPGWGMGDLLTQASDGTRNRFYQVVAATTFTKE